MSNCHCEREIRREERLKAAAWIRRFAAITRERDQSNAVNAVTAEKIAQKVLTGTFAGGPPWDLFTPDELENEVPEELRGIPILPGGRVQ